jgi:hypothetical protein
VWDVEGFEKFLDSLDNRAIVECVQLNGHLVHARVFSKLSSHVTDTARPTSGGC